MQHEGSRLFQCMLAVRFLTKVLFHKMLPLGNRTMRCLLVLTPAITMIAGPLFAQDSFTFSAWGLSANGFEVEVDCTDFEENCQTVSGGGLYANGYFGAGDGAVLVDLTIEQHREMDNDENDEPAEYLGLGVHYIGGDPSAPWGVFGAYLDGENHNELESVAPGIGVGLEKAWGNAWIQGAYFKATEEADDVLVDGFETFYFIGGGNSWALGHGELSAHAFFGGGDWQGLSNESVDGQWYQIGAEYSGPISDTSARYFVGLDVDHVDDNEAGSRDLASMSTIRLGLTFKTGGKAAPFRTPNLRAPFTNFAEMN